MLGRHTCPSTGARRAALLSWRSAKFRSPITPPLRGRCACWMQPGLRSECAAGVLAVCYNISSQETSLPRQLCISMPQLAGRQQLHQALETRSGMSCLSPVMRSEAGFLLRSRSCRSSSFWQMSPPGALFWQSSRTSWCASACMGGGSARRAAPPVATSAPNAGPSSAQRLTR